MSARWLVYACRTDYTADVVEIVARLGAEPVLVDNLPDAPAGSARPGDLTAEERTLPAVVPLITPGHRFTVVTEARELGLTCFDPLLDPTAIVPPSTAVGEGSVVNAGTVLGGEVTLGRFVHLNRASSVGHHSVFEDFTTLGPGCVLAGRVHVESGAFVGAGAVLAPKVRIGANAIVGAGAVVVKNVPPGAVVVGNPAQVMRQGPTGYGGVSVPYPAP